MSSNAFNPDDPAFKEFLKKQNEELIRNFLQQQQQFATTSSSSTQDSSGDITTSQPNPHRTSNTSSLPQEEIKEDPPLISTTEQSKTNETKPSSPKDIQASGASSSTIVANQDSDQVKTSDLNQDTQEQVEEEEQVVSDSAKDSSEKTTGASSSSSSSSSSQVKTTDKTKEQTVQAQEKQASTSSLLDLSEEEAELFDTLGQPTPPIAVNPDIGGATKPTAKTQTSDSVSKKESEEEKKKREQESLRTKPTGHKAVVTKATGNTGSGIPVPAIPGQTIKPAGGTTTQPQNPSPRIPKRPRDSDDEDDFADEDDEESERRSEKKFKDNRIINDWSRYDEKNVKIIKQYTAFLEDTNLWSNGFFYGLFDANNERIKNQTNQSVRDRLKVPKTYWPDLEPWHITDKTKTKSARQRAKKARNLASSIGFGAVDSKSSSSSSSSSSSRSGSSAQVEDQESGLFKTQIGNQRELRSRAKLERPGFVDNKAIIECEGLLHEQLKLFQDRLEPAYKDIAFQHEFCTLEEAQTWLKPEPVESPQPVTCRFCPGETIYFCKGCTQVSKNPGSGEIQYIHWLCKKCFNRHLMYQYFHSASGKFEQVFDDDD